MSDQELATLNANALAAIQDLLPQETETEIKQFEDLVDAKDFFAILRFFSPKSDQVQEGKIGGNHYGLFRGKDSMDDLGENVDVLPLAYRPKAVLIENKAVVAQSFDQEDETYKRIRAAANQGGGDSGAIFGPEFLLWIPKVGEFVTFHMANKTARNESTPLRKQIGKATTLGWQLLSNAKYKWTAPKVNPSTVPMSQVPPLELTREKLDLFKNPKVNVAELATGDEVAR